MSADVPRYDRYAAGVSLPSAPGRAVLQSITTQDAAPLQRNVLAGGANGKLMQGALEQDALASVQDRLRSAASTRPREHLAPLSSNVVPGAPLSPPKRAPAAAAPPAKDAPQSKKPQLPTPPKVIVDPEGNQYFRQQMLGQGGFARVFQVTDRFGQDRAFKVIAKSAIMQSRKNRQKILAEIMIHKSLNHHHIVKFEDMFEDAENVYFVLELCHNGNMNDIVKRRGRYTEPEARYFMIQILSGCQNMHRNSVIHRDLKLGNVFLDKDMQVKIGDFGLAALLKYPEERKKTVCGTPNYIAPEILYDQGEGHSFEVDVWSVGVILYTLIVGRPPFQTSNVQKIYDRIRRNEYEIPAEANVSHEAQSLIRQILSQRPSERPTLNEILAHPWFYTGPIPLNIPATAVYEEPYLPALTRADSLRNLEQLKANGDWHTEADEQAEAAAQAAAESAKTARQEMRELEQAEEDRDRIDYEFQQAIHPGSPISTLLKVGRQPLVKAGVSPPSSLARQFGGMSLATHGGVDARSALRYEAAPRPRTTIELMTYNLSNALAHFDAEDDRPFVPIDADGQAVNVATPHVIAGEEGELRAKPEPPRVFVISWLDHSEKYGLGYALCNGTVGVHFRDATSMLLAPQSGTFDYVYGARQHIPGGARTDQLRRENYTVRADAPTSTWLPQELAPKYKLMRFFENEIMERLYGADSPLTYVDDSLVTGMMFVHKWYRCKQAIVFRLSNSTVQFNFYDHTKLFLSQDGLVVSAIEPVDKTEGVPILRTWTLAEMVAIAHPRRSAAEAAAAAAAGPGATQGTIPQLFHTKPSERRLVRQLIKKLRYVRDVLSTTTSASRSIHHTTHTPVY